MSGEAVPAIGQTYVQGHDPAMARRLLDAAVEVGLTEDVVRTTIRGFIVPNEVWDAVASAPSDADGDAAGDY